MRRPLALVAIWLFVLLSPVTVWVVVGDLSYTGDPDLDYMYEPPRLTSGQQRAIAATVATVAAAAVMSTVLAYPRRLVGRADFRVALPVLLAGAYCGLAGRVTTAGGIGANIGGALVVMAAPFFLLAMLVWFGLELRRFRANRWY